MSKGYHQHQQRHQGLNQFGKELTRRSGASCELCDISGVKLVIYEVPPIPAEPDIDHCVFVCETCNDQIDHPKRRDTDHWRCLTRSVWSTEPAIQVLAVYMARQLADHADWVPELLEQLYLAPEIEAWLDKVEL